MRKQSNIRQLINLLLELDATELLQAREVIKVFVSVL